MGTQLASIISIDGRIVPYHISKLKSTCIDTKTTQKSLAQKSSDLPQRVKRPLAQSAAHHPKIAQSHKSHNNAPNLHSFQSLSTKFPPNPINNSGEFPIYHHSFPFQPLKTGDAKTFTKACKRQYYQNIPFHPLRVLAHST